MLPLTPFNLQEKNTEYVYTEFVENNQKFTVLREKLLNKINSGNRFKFGCISNTGDYYWFFYGKVTCKTRKKAIKTYNALLKYCINNKLGKPFAYKEK